MATAHPDRGYIRKVAFASFVGTTIEWYDYFLYGTVAALIFNKLFFPDLDPSAGTLAAFATFSVGFIARPVGAAVCGHFGDRVGRKTMLMVTLLVMGLGTVSIGLLPTYDSLGIWAAVLLTVLRFAQGLGLGGEWGGAVLMAVEHAPKKRRGFYGSWPAIGVPAGSLLSTAAVALCSQLPDDQFEAWGWRIPFVGSIVMVGIGFFIRTRIVESPEFAAVKQSGQVARVPLFELVRTQGKNVLLAMGCRIAPDIVFYVSSVFVLSYITQTLGLDEGIGLTAIIVASFVLLFTIPASAALSDRVGGAPVYAVGAALFAVSGPPFFFLVDTGSPVLIGLAIILGLGICHGVMVGPQPNFYAQLFDTRVRYSGATIGYQLGAPFAGGLAPIVATWLVSTSGGATWPVMLYMFATGAITLACTFIAGRVIRRGTVTTPSPTTEPASEPASSTSMTDAPVRGGLPRRASPWTR